MTPDTPNPALLAVRGVEVSVLPETGHEMMRANPAGFAEIVVRALG